MQTLRFLTALAALAACWISRTSLGDEPVNKHVLELRTYTFKEAAAVAAFDKYAADALIPALNRLGIQPVGAFKMADQQPSPVPGAPKPDSSTPKVMLLLPAKGTEILVHANARVAADAQYQKAAADYLKTPSDQPLLARISSELLVSFDAWPHVKVPKQKAADQKRLFELRTYESPSEQLGHLKVEMFNSGEVPIFLACDIQPVFMGQAVVGDVMPNLTYMTVYDNADELAAAWKRFSENAEWKVLREVAKYKGTVSKIHKSNWEPTGYSQL
ncbi:MAG: NIPSNAP family protein [Pirellulaceae bacterium]|nr:NIPSNAP family protein [Pirellulaceae bacterium]